MNKNVYIAVFSSQERHFDDFERSYLPLFHTVFGVYEDMGDAVNDVYRYFFNKEEDGYEMVEINCWQNEHGDVIGHSFTINYTDSKHGGYAVYNLDIETETVYKKGFSKFNSCQ